MTALKIRPYQPHALPAPLDWESLIPTIGEANRALASFNGVLYGMPNPKLLLSPLTTKEAVLSSKIEGTQATFGEVLEFEAGEEPEQESTLLDIQEILNYRTALLVAGRELRKRPFHLNLLLELHSVLLNSVRGRNKGRGRFRTVQNWIGVSGAPIEMASYIPPEPHKVSALLDNWEKYYHTERPDPLAQLAILHGQFELIHPFVDGNGRIGRILIPLFLYEKGLLSSPVFYLSDYIEQHKQQYINGLRYLSSGRPDAWDRWVSFFLIAVTDQANRNLATARGIIELYERSKGKIIDLTRSQHSVPLLDRLFERPVFSPAQLWNARGMPSKQMTMGMLSKLKDAGILAVTRQASGRRPQILMFRELVELCDGRPRVSSRASRRPS
jgi:Fic family protein